MVQGQFHNLQRLRSRCDVEWLEIDVVSGDGKKDSYQLPFLQPHPLAANEKVVLSDVYVDFLPKGPSHEYTVTAHIKGWTNDSDPSSEFEGVTAFLVK